MKKCMFVGFAVLGFSEISENMWGMNPPNDEQCLRDGYRHEEVKQTELGKVEDNAGEIAGMSENHSANNPELATMAEALSRQIETLQNQVNELTTPKILPRYDDDTVYDGGPTPSQERDLIRGKLYKKISELWKQRDECMAYIDGRKKRELMSYIDGRKKSPIFCSFVEGCERAEREFERRREIALKTIPGIDAQLNELFDVLKRF